MTTKTKRDMRPLRQGDVLLVPVEDVDLHDAKPVAREGGRIVLARGEVTGHVHAIKSRSATLLERAVAGRAAERFLRVTRAKALLGHEEHSEILVPPGLYRVVIQQEYTPEALRNVAD